LKFQLPKIYPITDVGLSGLSHTDQTARLIYGGSTLIQLREKTASGGAFFEDAKRAVELAHGRNAKVIINDRVDIALMSGADGVHLGQDDLPIEEARHILGPSSIIGYSTHTLEQAEIAARLDLDYVAFGPIYPTITKVDPDSVVGLNQLTAVKKAVGSLRVVAIGGITASTIGEVLRSGADSVALIGALHSSGPNIEAAFKRLTEIAEAACVKTP